VDYRQAKILDMGPVPRERFNAKARQSTAGSHKKQKQKQSKSDTVDPNEEVYIPKTNEEKESDRKQKLKQQASPFLHVLTF
jgi:ATP-dependent RNA helicase DHX37/DHR1